MLEMDSVRFGFSAFSVDFTLDVPENSCTALIGPSGSGKTTLLSLVAGFEEPVSGEIWINGKNMCGVPASDRPVTTVFQEHNLFSHLDAWTNVALGLNPRLKLTRQNDQQIRAALLQVGLGGMERRLPGQLSGGQRQRVALARCLVRDRPLLLLDEAFAGLGPAQRREMLDLVGELQRERGLTVLIVTHLPSDARQIADTAVFVCEGQIAAIDRTETLLRRTDLPALTDYLGSLIE